MLYYCTNCESSQIGYHSCRHHDITNNIDQHLIETLYRLCPPDLLISKITNELKKGSKKINTNENHNSELSKHIHFIVISLIPRPIPGYSMLVGFSTCYIEEPGDEADLIMLTFSALVSLAEQRSHLSLSSSFLATHSSYLAWRAAMPSSTSLSLALASFRIRSVSSRDSLASFKAA